MSSPWSTAPPASPAASRQSRGPRAWASGTRGSGTPSPAAGGTQSTPSSARRSHPGNRAVNDFSRMFPRYSEKAPTVLGHSPCYKCHLESIEETNAKLSLTALILIDPPFMALGPPEHGGTFAGTLTVK